MPPRQRSASSAKRRTPAGCFAQTAVSRRRLGERAKWDLFLPFKIYPMTEWLTARWLNKFSSATASSQAVDIPGNPTIMNTCFSPNSPRRPSMAGSLGSAISMRGSVAGLRGAEILCARSTDAGREEGGPPTPDVQAKRRLHWTFDLRPGTAGGAVPGVARFALHGDQPAEPVLDAWSSAACATS